MIGIGMMDIIFGSNRYVQTNGIIEVRGKELIKVEMIPFGDKYRALVTAEVRDRDGKLLGKISKSNAFVYTDPDYDSETIEEEGYPKSIILKNKKDGQIFFKLTFNSPEEVEINGVFYAKGFPYPIVAEPDKLTIRGITMRNNTFENLGKGIVIE